MTSKLARVGHPRVSVVVAAYNSPPELDDLVASLDAQTLATDRWEVRFVDDGSTDDTYERLQGIVGSRTNFSVETIPNSGWPGRPRNVAVARTTADYVFFADHDDYLFPDALRRMVDFAAANDLDVVHPKEVVSGWKTPGWRSWPRQEPSLEHLDQQLLQCITPHKLYRRQFLLDHDIAFPEGPVRLEDFSYNAEVWSRTDRIGILADYPCYRWMIYDDNSHKGGYDFDVYWGSFEASLQPIVRMPASEKKDHLLVRWYRSRILERLAVGFASTAEPYRTRLLGRIADLMHYFPEEIDRLLHPADRTRSALLRKNDVEGLLELATLDRGIRLAARSTQASWSSEGLHVSVRARAVQRDGSPLRFRRREDGSIVRDLPARLGDMVGDAAVVPSADDLVAEVVVRGRDTSTDWLIPTRSTCAYVEDGDTLVVEVTVDAVIDPAAAAYGRPLESEVHDLYYRMIGLGVTATHRIPAERVKASAAFLDGMPGVLYRTREKFLALDLGSHVRTVIGTGQPTSEDITRRLGTTRVALEQVACRGKARLPIELEIDDVTVAAQLRAGKNGAELVTRASWTPDQTVRAVMNGRRSAVLFA